MDLTVAGVPVATYNSGAELHTTLSPRPYLHPVRTLSGTVVTDALPEDHRWHLGVSIGVQDVNGANLWGGRTYVRDRGYTWLDDHGAIRHVRWRERTPSRLDEDLAWLGPDGAVLAHERREQSARPIAGGWALDVTVTLAADGVRLGSPATNGRARAGYGGFFWRLPLPDGPSTVFTEHGVGEEQVHYTRSPWLAYHGGSPSHPFTVVLTASVDDPWFVRQAGYPGLGSALAAESPVLVDGELRRSFTARVYDGHLAANEW
ncbi:PmoA family protein [Actinokineospora sp. UTMC 2448]|uniref:DUF6807 domain-containing protein n=1 Tax=Actinokineospora sp. UTMC 2448 TaxID=2268449 RepID=UPI002164DCF4|nr:PmoA family protein [Actinokineospora sp. UTMC 2448]UVS78932.1 hypothetical protein Actkin_02669 [Actinokineospora sp. UTMC 2448]